MIKIRFLLKFIIKRLGARKTILEVISLTADNHTIRDVKEASDFYATTWCEAHDKRIYASMPGYYSDYYSGVSLSWLDGYITALRDNSLCFKNGRIATLDEVLPIGQVDAFKADLKKQYYQELETKLFDALGKDYNAQLVIDKLRTLK